ncbi:hypothetical protein [Dyadobacter sp. CY326]|uniref:hypothetical protein n=1 Tax=Dyadobacter sp. CY326 TaxID=2907300 RepID=UPI001F35578A|nr:hypothetical protein [Dyadobacter sp. CY326]MCE7066608.1 hypothetical protein [Dyadobacter sp. CY326]
MKKNILLFILFWFHHELFAQTVGNVGINTYYPDPSAVLDVQAASKGVLLPRIFLQSTTDAGTIPNPQRGLLLFNTNEGLLEKSGFYFNIGTVASPFWKNIEENLKLPFTQSTVSTGPLVSVTNISSISTAASIGGFAGFGEAVAGISSNGTAISGVSEGTGTGIFASSPSNTALKVDGKIKITGGTSQPGLGKVLTSDGSGNASWQTPINEFDNIFNGFLADGVLGGGNQNMSESSFVKIAFANQKYDVGTNYNEANMSPHSSYIAPKNGIYHFDAMVRWKIADSDNYYGPTNKLVRIRNGVTTELSEHRAWSASDFHTSHIAIDCELFVGDVVNVIARSYGQQVALATFDADAHFNGHLAIEY